MKITELIKAFDNFSEKENPVSLSIQQIQKMGDKETKSITKNCNKYQDMYDQ